MGSPIASRRRTRVAYVLCGLLLLVLCARAFVGDIYRVDTGSMRPTILAGDGQREWLAVLHGAPRTLERFELLVVEESASGEALVKRLVGLGGETVELVDGDLHVNGAPLSLEVPRPPAVPVFDSELHRIEDYFYGRRSPPGLWTFVGRGATLDALDVERGSDAGLLFFQKPLLDDHLSADGERIPGSAHVHDARVSARVKVLEARAGAQLRLWLVEGGDTFEAQVELDADPPRARIVRRPGAEGQGESELAAVELVLAPLESTAWTFANIDNQLALRAFRGGREVASLRASYGNNRPHPGLTSAEGRSLGPQAAVGGTGVRLELEHLALERDITWFDQGVYGTQGPLVLGPDEIFVLGDNSAKSRDSRHFGPLPRAAILGRPVAVLWPPARARRLGRAGDRYGDRHGRD